MKRLAGPSSCLTSLDLMNDKKLYSIASDFAENTQKTCGIFDYQLAEPLTEQADLFDDRARWPRRPYCATSYESGVYPRVLSSAIKRPYLQANPPHLRVWSIYDIDRPGAALAWQDGVGLPPPSWAAVNPANKHAHLAWGLSVPVLIDSPEARRAPIRYLAAVESAFRERLQADPSYSGLITKNPAHRMWDTHRGPKEFYDLSYLAEWVDLPKHLPKQGAKVEEIGLGRNIVLFDFLRKWAYVAVRKEREMRNYVLWMARVYDRALERNGDFPNPLNYKEVHHVAKSITKWVWKNDPEAEARFLARQTAKGQKGGKASGVARLQASEDKRVSARLMRTKGMTFRAIAQELGAPLMTVHDWCTT